jgi:(p)ppGpp synthase/HD superfamily hydrolase
MVSRSAELTEVQAAAARRRATLASARRADRAAIDRSSSLARSARAFAARCHARQRRQSDGAPFIEHPLEVARLLRDAGCSDVVVAAGLLHDVVENTHVSIAELSACFGHPVASLVQAVSDDPAIESYRQRKQMLREQVRDAGGNAALIFAADKIAKVRELPDQVRRDREGDATTARGHRARNHHLEHDHRMRLEHYGQSLAMLQQVIPGHPLVTQLAIELDSCRIACGQLSA